MGTKARPRQVILVLCCYCMAANSILLVAPALCLSALAVDLGLQSELQKGLFLSAILWGMVLTSLLSGWAADRLGFRLLLLLSTLLQGVGLVQISLVQSPWPAIAGSFLAGLGRGMISAPLTALLCTLYPENRTRVTGIFHAFFHIGMVAFILLTLGLLQLDWNWRIIFQLFNGLILAYGVAALFAPLPGPSTPAAAKDRQPLWDVARQPVFVLLMAISFLTAIVEIGAGNWLPYFIELTTGASRTFSGFGLLLFAVALSVGRIAVFSLLHKWGVKPYFWVAGLVCVGSLLLAALPLGALSTTFWLAVLGLGISGVYPTLLGYAGDLFPRAGSAIFILMNSTAILGGVAGPLSIGLAADAFGLRPAMGLLALAPLGFIVLVLLIREPPRS